MEQQFWELIKEACGYWKAKEGDTEDPDVFFDVLPDTLSLSDGN